MLDDLAAGCQKNHFSQKKMWRPDWSLLKITVTGHIKKVVFSNESKFNLFRSDGIAYVRHPVGKRLNIKYISLTVKHGGGSIQVWGCFSGYGMGPLFRINGIMDRFLSKDILQNQMIPYLEEKKNACRCYFSTR